MRLLNDHSDLSTGCFSVADTIGMVYLHVSPELVADCFVYSNKLLSDVPHTLT